MCFPSFTVVFVKIEQSCHFSVCASLLLCLAGCFLSCAICHELPALANSSMSSLYGDVMIVLTVSPFVSSYVSSIDLFLGFVVGGIEEHK